jgi:hypothetical protein
MRLLAGGPPLEFHQSEEKIQVKLPAQAPDKGVSVVALQTI